MIKFFSLFLILGATLFANNNEEKKVSDFYFYTGSEISKAVVVKTEKHNFSSEIGFCNFWIDTEEMLFEEKKLSEDEILFFAEKLENDNFSITHEISNMRDVSYVFYFHKRGTDFVYPVEQVVEFGGGDKGFPTKIEAPEECFQKN